jgi:hypothetical protein
MSSKKEDKEKKKEKKQKKSLTMQEVKGLLGSSFLRFS